jgi:hypothetical protein
MFIGIAGERRRIVIKRDRDQLQATRAMFTIEGRGNQMQPMK